MFLIRDRFWFDTLREARKLLNKFACACQSHLFKLVVGKVIKHLHSGAFIVTYYMKFGLSNSAQNVELAVNKELSPNCSPV